MPEVAKVDMSKYDMSARAQKDVKKILKKFKTPEEKLNKFKQMKDAYTNILNDPNVSIIAKDQLQDIIPQIDRFVNTFEQKLETQNIIQNKTNDKINTINNSETNQVEKLDDLQNLQNDISQQISQAKTTEEKEQLKKQNDKINNEIKKTEQKVEEANELTFDSDPDTPVSDWVSSQNKEIVEAGMDALSSEYSNPVKLKIIKKLGQVLYEEYENSTSI